MANENRRSGEPENVIEVRDVVTRFGERVVHDGITLDVPRGKVTAIVGGSGSGKSTLLREIIMLHPVSEGTIRLFGADVTEISEFDAIPLRRRTGVMFQHGALFGDQTVLENVGVPLREHTSLSDELIDEIAMVKLAFVGLNREAAALAPAQLSGGMRKRAAMARALALDPELLCLDEPTSGLDPVTANALDELILELKELLGLTIVLVTHDMDSLWRVADHVALLAGGKMIGSGTMAELSEAEDPRIREFFAGPRGRRDRHAGVREGR
jgi:phospholipid/cholesterol/gamma-HCH transport system ATP-binding protein